MDMGWLEDFIAVVEERGFSRAAQLREVSQPAFSRRIRSLEEWIGAPLFDRSTHAVILTPSGECFLPVAEELLRRLRLGREEAVGAKDTARSTLRFAATHVLSMTFFPAWLRGLDTSFATIQLTADHMVACEKIMVEGRAQFLLCHHHAAAPTRMTGAFRSVKLGMDLLIPVASPALAAEKRTVDASCLTYSSESGMGRILGSVWRAKGRPEPRDPVFTSHLASVLTAMARDGRGVAWSPLSLITDDLKSGRLIRVGKNSDEVPIEIHLYRPNARQSPATESFWNQVLHECGDNARANSLAANS